jgi:copper chaperone CopZ
MEKIVLSLPAMYGDHHVVEVRRILLGLAGVKEVYASSSFRTAEVTFDPAETGAEQISAVLQEAGYLGELPVVSEPAIPVAREEGRSSAFRHATVYEQTRQVVSFAQNVSYLGRPLWPCPGMGVIRGMEES